jgi:hypothetical protein
MATPQQQAWVVVWYAKTKLFIMVQQNYQQMYGVYAPEMKIINAWFDKFLATTVVFKKTGGTHRIVSEEKVKNIRTAFQRSPSKFNCQALRNCMYHV